ncbi:DUF401 family protein [Thermodesulfovibrio sp.]|uniref:DUF401 family protein n=1 Tax=Thermodesulfovibrio sp. TaxID=2067987 RepID=UPI0030ABD870
MPDIVKVLLIFIFILFLLSRKIYIGYALIFSSLLFLVFYSIDFYKLPSVIFNGLTSKVSLNLFLSLTLIKSFEYALKQTGLMSKMTEVSQVIFTNKKISIISMPLIIGMLPSLGGAYLSAPMVESSTKNTNMTADEKAFVNYWYRHPWELILPLYPGIVLASAISGVSLRDLIIYNLPVAIIFFIFGFLISMRNVKNENIQANKNILKNIYSFIPICFVLFPVVIFKIDLYLSLFLNILFLCLWFKVNMKKLFEIIRYGFTLDVVFLVVGVIIFEEMLKFSGAVDAVASEITHLGIEPIYVFIFLPLFVGLITGVSIGFVGSTFPLLLHLKETFPYEISLAFVAGYTGVMISPLHLCLILTRNYFKADMKGIYRKIIPATFVMLFSALIEFAILRYYS